MLHATHCPALPIHVYIYYTRVYIIPCTIYTEHAKLLTWVDYSLYRSYVQAIIELTSVCGGLHGSFFFLLRIRIIEILCGHIHNVNKIYKYSLYIVLSLL